MSGFPVYICHKRVQALEIKSIGPYEVSSDSREIDFVEPGTGPIVVSDKLFGRYVAKPGDFYVIYDGGGYVSFSPRDVFLEGYSISMGGDLMMERLRSLAEAKVGGDPPEWLQGYDWAPKMIALAQEICGEIERLRGSLRQCVRGADPVEIAPGEVVGLHLAYPTGKGLSDIKKELKR